MQILVATKNKGKFLEISETFSDSEIKLLSLMDFDFDDSDFCEDGETFEENALKKAKYFYDQFKMPILAEDSGILVGALPGELGVKTRRWNGLENVSDEEWIAAFLKRMESEENRDAKFVCASCVYLGEDRYEIFVGETEGVLLNSLAAPLIPGLVLSSCFVPKGLEKVYAALSKEEKNQCSHRGKAMMQVKFFVENKLLS